MFCHDLFSCVVFCPDLFCSIVFYPVQLCCVLFCSVLFGSVLLVLFCSVQLVAVCCGPCWPWVSACDACSGSRVSPAASRGRAVMTLSSVPLETHFLFL